MNIEKKLIDSILDDQEKLAIQMFYDNKVQREAVRKVLLMALYNNGTLEKGKAADPLNNFTLGLVSHADEMKLSEAELGRHLKVAWEGIFHIQKAFEAFSLYKREEAPVNKKDNPAR